MPSVSLLTRLQEDLRLGLTCVKDLWSYEAKDWVTGVHAADIDLDGDIEVLAGSRDGRVSALTRDGRLRWEKIIGEKAGITDIVAYSPPSNSQKERLVASTITGKIYVLDSQGEEIPPEPDTVTPTHWYDVGQAITQMVMDPSRSLTVVFAADDQCVYSFDIASNRLRWRFPVNDQINTIFTYDVNGDGLAETLVGLNNQYLYILSSSGEILDKCQMDQAVYTVFAGEIDKDGTVSILVGTRAKKLYALTPNLQKKWVHELSSRPRSTSIVDVNNDHLPEILVSCDNQTLSILDTAGKQIWRQNQGKRYRNLNTFDLDLDGQIEILAGTDDSRVHALRIQLSKDLDNKIRRDYTALGKPDTTTLLELKGEQLDLLLAVLGTTYDTMDKKLSLTSTKALIEKGQFTDALLSLLKLEHQKFQLLWEKDQMGYQRVLCLANVADNHRRVVVAGSASGGLSVFNTKGHLLWSEEPLEGDHILDVQSGYLSSEHSEDLAFVTASGSLSIANIEKAHSATVLQFPEPATCFYLLAPGHRSSSEMMVGTASGKVRLYTNNLEKPARVLQLPDPIQRVYASEPDESGKYRNPELLIITSENELFAYTRGGNRLWSYQTRSRILALCSKDLDGDGHLEVLIGSEDRNIYVLDDEGNLRWRYVLYHSALALETADLDGDGKQEILVGCGDDILYVFTSVGDLIQRYATKDRIQALRIADIDLDGNLEIGIVEESRLEILRVVKRHELDELITMCWEHLFTEHNPLDILLPLIKGHEAYPNDPYLRAAGLVKLTTLVPLPAKTFTLLNDAMTDAFTDVRKILPEALMRAYPADPTRVRQLLNVLFTDRTRDVRIEVLEHLEILAIHDWAAVLPYLERALDSDERNTRRAALRKISHLLQKFAMHIKNSQDTLGETFFALLLKGTQDTTSTWVRQEAGRTLADFLNLFEESFLLYLYRLFSKRLSPETLQQMTYNLSSPTVRQAVTSLLNLAFHFDQSNAQDALENATRALEIDSQSHYDYRTGLWLICRELLALFNLLSIEKLATYDFRLTSEHFQTTTALVYPRGESFLRIGERLNAITHTLKTYLRRTNPNDRLNSLNESINALEALQRLVDQEYNVSPLPDAPQPPLPEFAALKALIARWQELFTIQRSQLRGHAELKCDLQSRTVHHEETVGIWLQIANQGRASARKIRITLLSHESFTLPNHLPQVVEIDIIPGGQNTEAEFLIKPTTDSIALTFDVTYDDSERKSQTTTYQDHLSLMQRPKTFTPIENNPYTTGTPIHDSHMCYGREADLAYLQKNLIRETQTLMVLYGQRKSGKTTLLNQLAHTNMLAQHIPVMIDMQKWAYDLTLNKLFFYISGAIYKALLKKGLSIQEPLRRDFFDQPDFRADPIFSFELFLDKLEIVLENRKLILLLDEFEVLENQVQKGNLKPEIFEYLRSLMQERHTIHFLLSGTHRIEELTRNYWSVFFNIALHYRLPGKISSKGAQALITEPIAGSLEFEPQVVNKIRLLTADQPYLIHLVCRALIDHCNEMQKNYATLNDVNLVLKAVLETGTIHFEWLWNRLDPAVHLLLLAIVDGSSGKGRLLKLDDICAIYRQHQLQYQRNDIFSSLKTLWAEDVVETNNEEQQGRISENDRFSLSNGLLRQWLNLEKPLTTFLQAQQTGKEQAFQPVENKNNGFYAKRQMP